MTDYRPPCKDNPDQWYTERDGRRHDGEVLVTADELEGAFFARQEAGDDVDPEDVLNDLLEAAVKQRIIERRQAREACFGCAIRLTCLDTALTNREQYGIWGGYFPEQRRELERNLDIRDRKRFGVPGGSA